jgi:hypothetical protein
MKMPLTGGTPAVLSTDYGINGLAVDATSVYWTWGGYGAGGLKKAARAGGAAVPLAAGEEDPNSVSVDATNAYFTSFGLNGTYSNRVVKVPIAGGAPVILVPPRPFVPGFVTSDGTNVYWSENGHVWRVPVAGGSLEQIAGPKTGLIVVDATRVYFTQTGVGLVSVPK